MVHKYKLTDESKEVFKKELKSVIEIYLDKLIDMLEFEIDEQQVEVSKAKEQQKTDFFDGMIIRVRSSEQLANLVDSLRKLGYKWNSEYTTNNIGAALTEKAVLRIINCPDNVVWIITKDNKITYWWYNEEDMGSEDFEFIDVNEEEGLLYEYDEVNFPKDKYLNGTFRVVAIYAGNNGYVSPYINLYDEIVVKDGRFKFKDITFPLGAVPIKDIEELNEYLAGACKTKRKFSNCQIIVEEVKDE